MRKPFPKWVKLLPEEDQILEKKGNAKRGWIPEVDLKYPQELHKEHNSFPLTPEKKVVLKEWMPPYQNSLLKIPTYANQTPKSSC